MTIDEAFEKILQDEDMLASAGPAVLRLKLLEVTSIAQRRNIPDDILEAARLAAAELKKLISERPCVSLVDFAAREKVLSGGALSA
jgi:hypothetical protein